ncbi:O-methyltransferase [Streptoalloteichus tenebrarius]|uniref:O-methyltransferase n=1 Tax=Streptoalloteichus tenebrarius (strain ATCC 17920 / DSM 40477 / JCM 4838 / CBS 697.72 / NBRC 16177 / NCIMB 11028 / NRRL B-12390 / A12253. 1 / ISP 5477) TaxID=1933 RepID=A0ABT1HQM3_STRSD|nr:methyltransferase [Streptoalloteichus tenebrarius]MCP2257809.1 O-methyltransferase [Streptoalloteichus tenebrarius]BFE99827.1 methyltransferase [Streptoalloteichus tenebrarius]
MTDEATPAPPATPASDETRLLNEIGRMASLMAPWAIRVAATLRLPDLVARGVTGADELAARTGSDADALNRLLLYLSALDVFRRTAPRSYELTELGELLREDHPIGLRAFLDQNGFGARLDQVTAHLATAVRTGRSVYRDVFGRSFWKDQDAYQDETLSFNKVMASHTRWFGADLRRSYDWSSFGHVVDVGGGTGAGTFLAELLREHPTMRGTLVEDPEETALGAGDALAEVGDRCVTVTQSLFDPLPEGADAYVLTNILRNWDDENATRILRRCAEAAGRDSRVLVIERILTDDDYQLHVRDANLRILLLLGGKERELDEFRAVGRAAGLELTATRPTDYSHMYLVEYRLPR